VSCDRYILAGLEADKADALTRQRPFQTTRSGSLRRAKRRTAIQSSLDARRRFALAHGLPIARRVSIGRRPHRVASAAIGLEATAGTGWWRGSGPTSPCPICSWSWRHATVDRTSLAHAALSSLTWRRSGNNSGRFDAAGPMQAPPKGREAQPHICTQSHEQFVTCNTTPKAVYTM
jgi:hypothetical protein